MRHYESTLTIPASPKVVFAFIDDHKNFSSHMNKSSWMMAGGKMETVLDEGDGKNIGSHIKMNGKVFSINLFLDEQVSKYMPPHEKEWQTVGDLNLLVIGHYKMGFEITPADSMSKLKVYIDYELPSPPVSRILGLLFGSFYAKWCVSKMLQSAQNHFNNL